MALKPTPAAEEPEVETIALELGFYVKTSGATTGPFPTRSDAEAYISGQLAPQDTSGEVIEV